MAQINLKQDIQSAHKRTPGFKKNHIKLTVRVRPSNDANLYGPVGREPT